MRHATRCANGRTAHDWLQLACGCADSVVLLREL
jgi:hypothetical protein